MKAGWRSRWVVLATVAFVCVGTIGCVPPTRPRSVDRPLASWERLPPKQHFERRLLGRKSALGRANRLLLRCKLYAVMELVNRIRKEYKALYVALRKVAFRHRSDDVAFYHFALRARQGRSDLRGAVGRWVRRMLRDRTVERAFERVTALKREAGRRFEGIPRRVSVRAKGAAKAGAVTLAGAQAQAGKKARESIHWLVKTVAAAYRQSTSLLYGFDECRDRKRVRPVARRPTRAKKPARSPPVRRPPRRGAKAPPPKRKARKAPPANRNRPDKPFAAEVLARQNALTRPTESTRYWKTYRPRGGISSSGYPTRAPFIRPVLRVAPGYSARIGAKPVSGFSLDLLAQLVFGLHGGDEQLGLVPEIGYSFRTPDTEHQLLLGLGLRLPVTARLHSISIVPRFVLGLGSGGWVYGARYGITWDFIKSCWGLELSHQIMHIGGRRAHEVRLAFSTDLAHLIYIFTRTKASWR